MLDELSGLKNMQVSCSAQDAIVTQSGAIDPASVRLRVKENRKLSPSEVGELVDAYEAGASQAELTRRFGLHEQTGRAHLRRQGVNLRPQRALTDAQEAEAVRLYVEEMWSLAELAARFEVCQTAIRNVFRRGGRWRDGGRCGGCSQTETVERRWYIHRLRLSFTSSAIAKRANHESV